ncbi:protein IQ-DOMAIN 29-like isoform X2 [Telopea speciosissima]|nr:protein IQ-DOMAIN 29-like isoform X2 [Telopea speciosissima]
MEVTAAHSDSLEGCGRRISVRRDFPSGCGRKTLLTGKLPRKGISAPRNFPPGCGREKVLDEDPPTIGLKENIFKEMTDKVEVEPEEDVGKEEQFQVRTASGGNLELEYPQQTSVRLDRESNLYQPKSKSQSAIKDIEGNVGSLKRKLGKESVERCKKSSKRAIPGESVDENDAISKCHRHQSIGLTSSGNKVPWQPSRAALNFVRIHGEHSPRSNLGSSSSRDNMKKHELMVKKTALAPSNNRVIVQALMAAPNCPWRQGRQKIKHNLTHN